MSLRQRFVHQITHWANTGDNGFGGYTFSSPVILQARWSDAQRKFFNLSGEEKVSQSVVHLDVDVIIGDWLALGDLSATDDPTSITGAYEVQGFNKVTNLRNSRVNRKAFL